MILCFREEGEKFERAQTGARDRRAQSEFFYHWLKTKNCKWKSIQEKPFDYFQFVLQVSVDELCKRFTSNVADGLTDDQVFFLLVQSFQFLLLLIWLSGEKRDRRVRPEPADPSSNHPRMDQVLPVPLLRLCHAPLVWSHPLLPGIWHPGLTTI